VQAIVSPSANHQDVFEFLGNKTECALLVFSLKLSEDEENFSHIRHQYPVVYRIPFSSSRKRMISVILGDHGTYRMYIKGAPEIILERCTSLLTESGNTQAIESSARARVELDRLLEAMANDALRTLALAYRDLPADWFPENMRMEGEEEEDKTASIEQDLTLIAIVGIEVPQSFFPMNSAFFFWRCSCWCFLVMVRIPFVLA